MQCFLFEGSEIESNCGPVDSEQLIADEIQVSAPTDKLLKPNHADSLVAHCNSSISYDDLPLMPFNNVHSKTDVALANVQSKTDVAKPLEPNRRPRRVLRSEAQSDNSGELDYQVMVQLLILVIKQHLILVVLKQCHQLFSVEARKY